MVRVQSPPGRRELPYARVLLLPAIAMAAATGAAAALVAQPARTAVGLCGGIATLLVIATAAEAVRRGRRLRAAEAEHARRTAYLEQRVASHEEENERLALEHLPQALDRMHKGNSPREVLRQLSLEDPHFRALSPAQLEVVKTLLRIVDHEEALRDSSQRSFVSVARRVQAIVHQQAKELREMEEDHGRNPEVFDDLLRVDHGTAMIGRLADSVAVLGGGRPGRQWPLPVPLYSVLRGAMSRILEYPRISLDNIAKVNIRGISVEPVIHACAELLDNATRYSPPHTKVHVTATEVQTGIAIEIEDSGVSLTEEARLRLEGVLEKAKRAIDLQAVSEAPRLGLAVVGRLCTAFNMQISLRPSAYGGTRAILVVPREMVTSEPAPGYAHGIGATSLPTADTDGVEGPKRPPKRRRPTNPRVPDDVSLDDDEVPVVTEWTEKGLPQRRSKVKTPISQRISEQYAIERAEREGRPTIWSQHRPGDGAGPEAGPQQDDRPPGLWVESFWQGLRKGLPEGADPTEFTRHPEKFTYLINDPAHPGADDEGDLT
ncbi:MULTISPECIES: sensor histidine kinase KdpD [unclassified Streptomyces]|uniref:sensor histidine kinase n=1 Tax=unclassified Streptomyces TaxID=2593676 RepID=UPI001F04CF7D|nr:MULTISPECIES: ATP-binding protein [unclassified Streptomyces]MCH0565487.1 sensor histidine kinase [Streptomyces sp. MUM 2J]MCH0569707.1 sensor histidine kinase [Streptomyces sp. MUM 136J]